MSSASSLEKYSPSDIGTAIASAATIAPTHSIHHVTGTTAIDTITPPPDFVTGRGGTVVLIPDALWTCTASGNIAVAVTAVLKRALYLTYDPATSKFYPSYT